MPPRSEFSQRIFQHLEQLGPKERQLADFLLVHEADLAMYSSADMARLTGVSKPVVSRFFKRLGYESFAEARQDLRSLQSSGSPLLGVAAVTDIQTLLESHRVQEARNLEQSLAELQRLPLETIVAQLLQAKSVKVIGYRNSYPVALHWRQQLLQVRQNVDVLPQPGQTLAEELSQLSESDLVIVVALRRRTANVSTLIDVLQQRQIPTVLMTDPSGIALADKVSWMLTCHQLSPAGFASYAAAMAVVCVLMNLCQQQQSEDSRVQQIDSLFEVLDELE